MIEVYVFSFDVVNFFLFCCRLPSFLMFLSRTELHSQDMINEKLQKAEELGMESFPCPLGLLLDDFKSSLVCYSSKHMMLNM